MDFAEPAAASDPGYLARLNPAQRAAVLHGGGAAAGPLLVIAGAGTGKTNTLVHRLAHLVLAGADPRRILLMTFSRRAAAEMTRRAERIAAEMMGPKASVLAEGLTWAGTFHADRRAPSARPCRRHRPRPGLHHPRPRGFRRPDEPRPPSPRLLGDRAALPGQVDLPRDLLARGQRPGPARRGARRVISPGAPNGRRRCRQLFAAYVAAKQENAVLDYDDLLLYWAGMMQDAGARGRDRRALRSRAGRRIPGHQPAAGGDPARR